jgi:hypothetical protein
MVVPEAITSLAYALKQVDEIENYQAGEATWGNLCAEIKNAGPAE